MSRTRYILFAVVSFLTFGVVFSWQAAFFIQEFGGAMNPSIQFRGQHTRAFIGAFALLGAIVLPIGSLLMMPDRQNNASNKPQMATPRKPSD